jgi:chorismate mutase/prephenate dehydrogenase
MSELDQLRQKVAQLDLEIMQKVAERIQTSKAIGEAKRRAELPIRDFRVEAKVMQRAREAAQRLGFDPGLAESILEMLIEAAVRTQAENQVNPSSLGSKRILLVGGAGRMGQWLQRFLQGQGHQVEVCDPKGPIPSLEAAATQSWEVVVLTSPLGSLPEVLRQALQLPGKPLIFDIGSLKSHLVEPLRQAAREGHRVASLHPMFAPGTVVLTGRSVLVCDAGNALAKQQAADLFRDTAVSLCDVPLDQHDAIMGALLGLSHTTNLLFGRALTHLGLPFAQLGPIASTTFAKQVKTASEVSAENAELYHQIQHLNQHTPHVYSALQKSLEEFQVASQAEDSQAFLELMQSCRDYFFQEVFSPIP